MSTRNKTQPKLTQKGGLQKAKSASSKSHKSGMSSATAPAAKGSTVRFNQPKIESLPKGGTRIRHREYVFNIFGSDPWAISAFTNINPGNVALFNWLSTIATRYETYTFNSLSFYFESLVPTSQAGAVYLAVDYDVLDPRPQNLSTMMAYSGAVRNPAWNGCELHCPVSDLQKVKIRNCIDQAVPRGADQRLYDVGNLIISANTPGFVGSLGEIYVEYDVVFQTPCIESASDALRVTLYPIVASGSPTAIFSSVNNYTMHPLQNRTSVYSIGPTEGLETDQLSINKRGTYAMIWTLSAPGTPGVNVAPVSVVPVDTTNVVTGICPGYAALDGAIDSAAGYHITVLQILVENVPAVFDISALAAVGGAGGLINSGSSFVICPLDFNNF